ncbi:MAG TPA: hypothetical protein VGN52_21800 [Burkholderiales bacterium]|jgi:hypothetical protein
MSRSIVILLLPLFAAIAGCDQIAVLDGSKAREADGVAVGSACRQAGRAIEDCFTMNPDAAKASVFAGWKEMNDYMAANKLEPVTPQVPRPDPAKESAKEGSKEAAKGEGEGKAKEGKKEASHAAAGKEGEGAAETASSAPGVPVVPATVNIPGLNTNPAAAPSPAPTAAAPAPAATTVSNPAPNSSSIALGGQNIPLAVPGTPAAGSGAAPTAGGGSAHH